MRAIVLFIFTLYCGLFVRGLNKIRASSICTMRTLEDIQDEVEGLLGNPPRQASGFAPADWSGVTAICSKEGNPRGTQKLVAQLIGVKRDTLGHRIASGSTAVHGRGPAPVIPTAVSKAIRGHLETHQLCGRAYPYRQGMLHSIKTAAALGLRLMPVTPRMVKHVMSKVKVGKKSGERTGAQRTMSISRKSIKAWHLALEGAGCPTMAAFQKVNGDEHALIGRAKSSVKVGGCKCGPALRYHAAACNPYKIHPIHCFALCR